MHEVGGCDQRRHRAERLAAEVEVEDGGHDPYAPPSRSVAARLDGVAGQELRLVDRDQLRRAQVERAAAPRPGRPVWLPGGAHRGCRARA